MKVTFIRPNMSIYKAADALQPLAFSILAGITPDNVEIEFYDDRIEKVPENINTDLVVLSVETFTARRAYQLALKYKKMGLPVIMGGFHPSFLPHEVLKFADSVVIGDAEGIWEKIIEDAASKKLSKVYRQDKPHSLNGIVYDRSIFKGKKYAPIYPVQFGRGCKYSCDFCSINAFYGNSLRQRPVDEVIAEIEYLGKKHIFIVDDNICIDGKKAREFFTKLIPLKVRWTSQVSIDIVNDPELLKLMAKSGCMTLLIGFESLDKRNLLQMGKGVNIKNSDYSLAIKKIREHGIMVYGTFILGYDYDTQYSFEACLEFAIKNKIALANFNPLMTMPGTDLYARMKLKGSLIYDKWWLDPEYRYGKAMFNPAGMSAFDLTEGCKYARYKFSSYSSILKRVTDFKANCSSIGNLSIFLVSNAISRREIFQKQGILLGDDMKDEDVLEVANEDNAY
ncbi:Radical SAM superfamily enzyme YgiQ, UPF0313 family [Peptoclostridium litorale DSM 5388]|uniref:Methyltransferase n=1 Tax=Peptoclostridium litorale DSM 5388 TaxID=1121324 RepID=A0A069RI19_PEPLI|nr:radical SAM protein [Peptoclostridium litorale]KDR96621.1 methyltransferase [Peptoclostridium litorale DSM 5388]SIN68370.1 Radical SAM superfamily enzyme YgiQ, UPF0313 family [Peptoclostridium litorale DSM 5388]